MDLQEQQFSSSLSSSASMHDLVSSTQIYPLQCSFHPLVQDLRSSSSSSSSSSSFHGRSSVFRLSSKPPRSKSRPPKTKKAEEVCSLSQGNSMRRQRCPSKGKHKETGKICSCVAGFSADCAAMCCCPLILLHLLSLVFFRLPAAIAIKLVAHLKKILRRNGDLSNATDKSDTHENLTSAWPRMSEYFSEQMAVDRPALEFPDETFLREYFECKHLGFGGLD